MSELERWVSASEIGPGGLRLHIEAGPAELKALAKRYRVPAVLRLEAEVELRPVGRARFRLSGRVKARLRQLCVVTLDELENDVAEDFEVDFDPNAEVSAETETEIDFDAEAEDPPEPLIDGRIPVGEMVAQHLALAIDPYPRAPDAVLEADSAEPEVSSQSPFAILRKLS